MTATATTGFDVIGVHTPEYAFEREQDNVVSGARDLGITYPVALDNGYSTWTNYRNRYWPAKYLIDSSGTVRHIKFGEGDYATTEKLIRELLAEADPEQELPPPVDSADTTPRSPTTPETYLSVGKVVNYGGTGTYDEGTHAFDDPPTLADNSFALRSRWRLDYQGATSASPDSGIALNYHAAKVYIVAGGDGDLVVRRDGETVELPIGGPPTLHPIVDESAASRGHVEVTVPTGVQVYSFTYG